MKRHILAVILTVTTMLMLLPSQASAQYKNKMFGLGLGTHNIFASKDVPSMQFTPSGSLGFESLFKMGHDHWWFGVKLNIGFMAHRDPLVRQELGVLMDLQAGLGVRWVILTDRIRPFIQFGGGYDRIFYFTGKDSAAAEMTAQIYLKHQNLGSLSATPGIEFVFKRNMSLQLAAECSWVIVYNDKQAFGLYPTLSFMFYM